MTKTAVRTLAGATVLALATIPLLARQQAGQPAPPAQPAAAAQAPSAGRQPVQAIPQSNDESVAKVPVGFTPIFNGTDLTGWHVSTTNHHGRTPDYRVVHGVIVGTQQPFGQGGVLLTDKKYRNVEVYMEVKPDWGCDSGLFLWTDPDGGGYQVMLDYLPGGTMVAGIYGERLKGVSMNGPGWDALSPEERQQIQARRTEGWQKVWKRDEWNTVRARIEGNPPRITTWLNDVMMFQGRDTASHATNGATDGSIAIQVHGGERWRTGGFWRWRVIAVKELPDAPAR
jgi:hypothetical protein